MNWALRNTTYKGFPICKKCGEILLEGNFCCRVKDLPADIRVVVEKNILIWVNTEEAKRKIGVGDLPRSEESYVRGWDFDVEGKSLKGEQLVTRFKRNTKHPNEYYEKLRTGVLC